MPRDENVQNGWAASDLPQLLHRGQYCYRHRDNNDVKYGLFLLDNDDIFKISEMIIDVHSDTNEPIRDIHTQIFKIKLSGEQITLHRNDVVIIRCIYVIYKRFLPATQSRAGIEYLFWIANPSVIAETTQAASAVSELVWEPDFMGCYDHSDYGYINEVFFLFVS
jgi:hypothetical protein